MNARTAETPAASAPGLHICSWCRRVRQPDGSWLAAHLHFASRSRFGRQKLEATHGICSDCYGVAIAQVASAAR